MPIERTPALFFCDISGLSAEGLGELDQTKIDEDDPLQDAPLGWTRITVATRRENDELVSVTKMYDQTVAQLQSDLKGKPEELENALWAVESQFEQYLDQPEFIVETSEIWVHPSQLGEALKRLDPDIDVEVSDSQEHMELESDPDPDEVVSAKGTEVDEDSEKSIDKKAETKPKVIKQKTADPTPSA